MSNNHCKNLILYIITIDKSAYVCYNKLMPNWEAFKDMNAKKITKFKFTKLIFGIFFAFVNLISAGATVPTAYAVPDEGSTTTTTEVVTETTETAETTAETTETATETTTTETTTEATTSGSKIQTMTVTRDEHTTTKENLCRDGLDSISWLLCPKGEKGSDAVDWLYGKIESVLEINPISGEPGSMLMSVWDICRGLTNIVFVIFFLIIIFSQITGLGISNYGIKQALPKLIIAAIAVNLSFYACSMAVDFSNIIGLSTRNFFSGIEAGLVGADSSEVYRISDLALGYSQYWEAFTTGAALTIGGVGIILETGAIFMLIPAILAGLVAVVSGLITISLRQVIIVLCVMIAPLAIVAYILPNTVNLFRKWRHTFMSMLVFYPLFSLLFGAASLAGFALTHSGTDDGVIVLLGMIIRVVPIILCIKMMSMSGTILNGANRFIRGAFHSTIVNPAGRFATSMRERQYARTLAKPAYTPTARLMQFMYNRRASRAMDTAEYQDIAKRRALSYNSNSHYTIKNGRIVGISKNGEEAYELQALGMRFDNDVLRDKNNFNKGLGQLPDTTVTAAQRIRLNKLDMMNVNNADQLFTEQARSATIDYQNAQGRWRRFEDAQKAHTDQLNEGRWNYKPHFEVPNYEALRRYDNIYATMDRDIEATQYAMAQAATVSAAHTKHRQEDFQNYFNKTVATQDIVHRLSELTERDDSSANIDAIISGMRALNARGDTDLVIDAVNAITAKGKLRLGTNASQALASFLQFEVKDNDPVLRRFGKYINLETARIFNDMEDTDDLGKRIELERKKRHKDSIDISEYVLGKYYYRDEGGEIRVEKPKRDAMVLLAGTKFANVERLAYSNLDKVVKESCKNEDGSYDVEMFMKKSNDLFNTILPNVIGDQLTYASGSEQITSFAKYLTGYKVGADGRQVFEAPLSGISDEDEKALHDFYNKRRDEFLKANVANQIARIKTDVLNPVIASFQDQAAEEGGDYHEMFRETIPEMTRSALAKGIYRGVQSDSKASLMKALNYDDPSILKHDMTIMDRIRSTQQAASESDNVPGGTTATDTSTGSIVEIALTEYMRQHNDSNTDPMEAYYDIMDIIDDNEIEIGSDKVDRIRRIDYGPYRSTAQLIQDIFDILRS